MMKKLLAHSTLAKAVTLLALTLLSVLPLSYVGGIADERGASRSQAAHELAESHARAQTATGAFIVVPYVERWTEEQPAEDGKGRTKVARSRQSAYFVFPEAAALEGRMTPQERRRGIFAVQFYSLEAQWRGRFGAFDAASLPHAERNSTIEAQAPVLAFAVSDVRGLQGRPQATLGGAAAQWQPLVPGLDGRQFGGIHAPLPPGALKAWQDQGALDFELKFTLVGQSQFSVVPLAGDNRAHIDSTWPHPAFGGRFLAARREVGDAGFDAHWAVSSLASAARTQFAQLGAAKPPELDTFGVALVEPVNVYSMTNRALKYGLLFVALTLLAAFLFELFKGLRLHPVQYGLVALALAVFFLLLLALSEKIPFAAAYAAAAAASVALLAVYFSAVLQGWRRGAGLASYVAVLYATLYGLLSSEDNALLLGALLLFGLLAVLMIGTRRVDWYALSARG